MTVTTTGPTTATTTSLWKPALVAGLAAAAATTIVAAVSHAAGVSLMMDGKPLPPIAFAQVTLMAVVLGYGLAVALCRWAKSPRRTFVRATVALTLLSFIPDLMAPVSTATRLTLIATHVVAAVIVIPVIAARLDQGRS